MIDNHGEFNRCVLHVADLMFARFPLKATIDIEELIEALHKGRSDDPGFKVGHEHNELRTLYFCTLDWLIDNRYASGLRGTGGITPREKYTITLTDKGLSALRKMPDSLKASAMTSFKEGAREATWSVAKDIVADFVNSFIGNSLS